MNNPLVSIIIPTYNRAHLIGETLDSVLAQTYSNWECIVVDDRSTDETEKLLVAYCENDSRFQYYPRPINRMKGGNAARNFGFEKSKGDLINWFDSDDIMLTDFILNKVGFFGSGIDYVISKTEPYSNNDKEILKNNNSNYGFDTFKLTHFNYVVQNINWYTPDTMLTRDLALKVKFNELIKRGQEYNFLVKLTLLSEKGFFMDKVLTLRRIHDESIKSSFSLVDMNKQAVSLRIKTYKEIELRTSKQVKYFLLKKIILGLSIYKQILPLNEEFFLLKKITTTFKFRVLFNFIVGRFLLILFNRNTKIRENLKRLL